MCIRDRYTTERSAHTNLAREGVAEERVRFVGNVMIDSLLSNREFAHSPAKSLQMAGIDPAVVDDPLGYGVVTLHRPSNVDRAQTLAPLPVSYTHLDVYKRQSHNSRAI